MTPVSRVAASRYCRPCSFTSVTINNAMAPVAAEIIPGRPPTKAIITAIQKEAYRPTLGSTPAIMEKAIASGDQCQGHHDTGEQIATNVRKPVLLECIHHSRGSPVCSEKETVCS